MSHLMLAQTRVQGDVGSGVPWSLQSDTDLVVTKDANGAKHLQPLVTVLYDAFRDHAMIDVEIADHTLTPKMTTVTREGAEVTCNS